MDIQMPIMNGYEAIKKIREFNEDVIITQSAFVFTDEAEKAIKMGGGYISKPIDKNKLIDHINNQMTNARHKKKARIIFHSIAKLNSSSCLLYTNN
jgi:YesN/AraC family two-component response regulator